MVPPKLPGVNALSENKDGPARLATCPGRGMQPPAYYVAGGAAGGGEPAGCAAGVAPSGRTVEATSFHCSGVRDT